MNKELQTYYEERFSMTSTQGWKDLMEDLEVMQKTYADISRLKSAEELHFAKGQLDIINWVLNIRKVSEEAYSQLNDPSI